MRVICFGFGAGSCSDRFRGAGGPALPPAPPAPAAPGKRRTQRSFGAGVELPAEGRGWRLRGGGWEGPASVRGGGSAEVTHEMLLYEPRAELFYCLPAFVEEIFLGCFSFVR